MDPEPEANPHFQIYTRDLDLILSRYPHSINLVVIPRATTGMTVALEIGAGDDAPRLSKRLADAARWLGGGVDLKDPLRDAMEDALDALRLGPPEMAVFILEKALGRE